MASHQHVDAHQQAINDANAAIRAFVRAHGDEAMTGALRNEYDALVQAFMDAVRRRDEERGDAEGGLLAA